MKKYKTLLIKKQCQKRYCFNINDTFFSNTIDFIKQNDILELVIIMTNIQSIIVTDVLKAVTVFLYQNKNVEITNREAYGLSFCLSGQLTYTIDGKKIISDTSNAVILPKNKSYTIHADKEGQFPVINFDCIGFDCDTIISIPLNNSLSCITDYEKIKSLFLFKNNRNKIFSAFYELLNEIYIQQIPQKEILMPIVEFIGNNISNSNLTNTMLAKNACISEVYLRQLFKKRFNITPKQYIINIRIEKAKELLTNPFKTVSSVAEECGFSSVYHFCREFKLKTGMTPGEYAKNNLINII